MYIENNNTDTIKQYLLRYELKLKKFFFSISSPSDKIKQAIHYSLFSGGKRFRPLLVYLIGEICRVSKPILDILSISIELIHCYSLMHDDLPSMDNDYYRRGKLSCHKVFGEATTILAGNGMQALAIEILLKKLPHFLSLTKVIKITNILLNSIGINGLISGQNLDLFIEHHIKNNKKQLYTINFLKTGKLIFSCYNMVSIAASYIPKKIKNLIYQYIKNICLVFQMQDDYLDNYIVNQHKKNKNFSIKNISSFSYYYSKSELSLLIYKHFKYAKQSIKSLKKNKNLLNLIQYLQEKNTIL